MGGGPAGVSAAVAAAARSGASVTLLERYAALGGLASGGMVLVLDDMINGDEITVTGIVDEYVERMAKLGLAVYPPERGPALVHRDVEQVGSLGSLRLPLPQQPQADLLRGRLRPRRLEAGLQRPGPRVRREPAAALAGSPARSWTTA